MIIDDIYKSDILKYPLTDEEYGYLDGAWRFLKNFENKEIFNSDFRRNIIKNIRKNYSLNEFYTYESIINKLFWNLRWLSFPLWVKEGMSEADYTSFIKNNYKGYTDIPNSLLLCKSKDYKDINDAKQKLKKSDFFDQTYYRSFINKIVIVDKVNKKIITKPIEGSSYIFGKNYFNLLTISILFDRELYEEVMRKPYILNFMKIKLSKYYHQMDYGLPNINFCTYQIGHKEDMLERIEKMYYYKGDKYDKYWFKLIL